MTRRALFVEGNRNMLRELEAVLRSTAGDWSVVCALSRQEALAQLSRGTLDVVVADATIEEQEGGSFLDEVAARQPRAARFLLSEHSGRNTLTRAGGSAHQHLARPLGLGEVFSRLDRTLQLGARLEDPALQELVGRLKSVPSLPPIYLAIMTELRNEETSTARVGQMVARDGGMSAKILQLANSPLFGFRMQVADPAQAVKLLGLEAVRSLVLSMHIFEQLDRRTVARFGLSRIWRHSLAAAGCARVIGRMQGASGEAIGEAFTAALLHDAGKLVLAASLPDDYEVVVEQAEAAKMPVWLAEHEVMGSTHAEVAACLLGLWGLPDPIVEAVAWHHRPGDNPSTAFCPAGAVHAADVIEHQVHPEDAAGGACTADDTCLERFQVRDQWPAWTTACLEAGAAEKGRNPARP